MRNIRFVPTLSAVIGAALLATGCEGGSGTPGIITPPAETDPPALSRTVVMNGLTGPWDIAFDADGAMFFTERCRGLSVRRPDGSVTRIFGTAGSALVAADFRCEGQSGMHGVALAPDFATSRNIFVFMLSTLSTPNTNRVVRLTLNAGYTSASGRTDVITDIAFKNVANGVGGAGAHSGGRIRFGPDGFLYVTTGDNHSPTIPQSPTVLGGKVLRVTTAGAAAPGNAPPAGFDARIFTYGHRNVQGITFRPGSGDPYISEHGPNHSDEVTRLVNGGNGGWDPQNRPSLNCPDGYCGYAGSPSTMPMTDLTRFPTALSPTWTTGADSEGLGPAAFLSGDQWDAWNGALVVGTMAGTRLLVLTLNSSGAVTSETNATTLAGNPIPATRYRALTQGPDGNLYIATDGGEIWRVTPSTP